MTADATVVPTPATPDVCSIKVLVDGAEISGEFQVLSASVSDELNRIPTATVQLRDGEAARQTFPASDTEHFLPGREIEIRLGYRGETQTVFTGLVTRHGLRVRRNGSFLSVECRDRAVRMTRAPRSRHWADTTDSEIIEELLDRHGLQRTVAATVPHLPAVVQYDATDWDFLVCRAEANGHVVTVRDGTVTVGPPDTGARPVVATTFGATVLELDAEIDARWQATGITATAWNATDQDVVEVEASEPSVTASGDLAASDLADVLGEAHPLRHGGRLTEPELQAWADGHLLRDRLAKVRGRVRFQGFGGVHAGDVVEVTGIGRRFSGPQYVSGVRHTFAAGNWETDVAFGLPPEGHTARYPVTALPAGGLLPAVNGLQVGIVTGLEDPDGEDRVQVRLPMVSTTDDGVWARLVTLDAGGQRGTFFRPEISDEVIVGFLDGDPRFPVVLGQCHSSAKPAPETATDDNHVKGYVSRSGMKLTFDDDTTAVVVQTPAGNTVTLSDEAGSVALVDQHGNEVTLDQGGVTITSSKDLVLKAAGNVHLEGNNVEVTAQARLAATGSAGVGIDSAATLTITGSLVQIN